MLKQLNDITKLIEGKPKRRMAVAAAHDENAFEAVINAYNKGIIEPILIGDVEKMKKLAENNKVELSKFEVINEIDLVRCAELAVKYVRDKNADVLMKGYVDTGTLLKAVLNKEWGLRSGDILSHIALFELPTYHKVVSVADAAMNVSPDLETKIAIIKNSVNYLNKLGIEKPKVALLAAVETVKEGMPVTLEYSAITMMNRRKQIKNCIIDGPLALDNAVSKESADHKGIISEVAGDADLLVAPNIEAANILYKTLIFLANAKCAAVIVGATAPIVLTSRSDSEETKLNSILLAAAGGF